MHRNASVRYAGGVILVWLISVSRLRRVAQAAECINNGLLVVGDCHQAVKNGWIRTNTAWAPLALRNPSPWHQRIIRSAARQSQPLVVFILVDATNGADSLITLPTCAVSVASLNNGELCSISCAFDNGLRAVARPFASDTNDIITGRCPLILCILPFRRPSFPRRDHLGGRLLTSSTGWSLARKIVERSGHQSMSGHLGTHQPVSHHRFRRALPSRQTESHRPT